MPTLLKHVTTDQYPFVQNFGVHNEVSSFIHTPALISDCQFGFRPGSSTQEALLYVSHDWHKPLDKRVSTAVIVFDLSKAFDDVSHSLLLFYLHKIGITGLLHRWFKE